ncbi:MAG: thermostable hemolysin [Patescibacteria group bacterium]
MQSLLSFHKCAVGDSTHQQVCEFAAAGYKSRYGVDLEIFPDIFIYAMIPNEKVVGCFGACFGSHHTRLTTEWYVSEQDLSAFVGSPISTFPREKLCEIGTRVVNVPPGTSTNSVRISVAMSAALLLHLYEKGSRFSLFTADRSVRVIAKQLCIDLVQFGTPDLSSRDSSYLAQWHSYFEVPRECFGFDLKQAVRGCYRMCHELRRLGFVFDPALLALAGEQSALAS